MTLIIGTSDGVWEVKDSGYERIGLADQDVGHVATRNGTMLAAVSHDGLYAITDGEQRRVWEGDARSCAIAPGGRFYVGTEPAMVFRSDDAGATWRRLDDIDHLPTRESWYFPPPPHQPHVRSIDFLPNDSTSVLVGVEVGGVLLSTDRGESWRELNEGVNVDVHTVRPDPLQAGRLVAVTGGGVYATEDGGASWERRMSGIGHGYTNGLHINPDRAGEVLVAAAERPPGLNAGVYHSLDAGRTWEEVRDPALPTRYDRVPVLLFADGAAWIATEGGQIFRADEPQGSWSLVLEVPATIYTASAGDSPSSIMGWR